MSWRDARAKVDRGFYKPKQESPLATGFAAAADIVAASWIKEAAEEKEAEKIRLKEEKAERKRIRAAQQKAEAKEKKLKDNAIYLARTYTNDPTNVSAVQFFHEQLKLMDGDVGDVMSYSDKLIENGRLSFIPSSTETETLEFQGPNVPANAKVADFGDRGTLGNSKFKDGTDVTLGDLPEIRDNDKYSDSISSQAAQMDDMFGHLAEGTTLPEPGEVDVTVPGGIEFTAAKRKYDTIDISKIKTFEDWSATSTDIKANSRNLDPDFMKFFNERGQNLQDLENVEEVEKLFSMDVLLGEGMTASKLQDRIDLAKAKSMDVPEYITSEVLPILQDRSEYTQKELIAMSPTERALVAKFSKNPKSRQAAAIMNEGDVAAYSWISEASSSADAMTAKSREFFQAGDLNNFNLASTMATSLARGEAQYKDLLKPTYLVGKTLEELTSIKRIAESGGATPEELVALGEEITAAQTLFDNSEYRRYAEGATNFDRTSTQITLATEEGASPETINALNALAAAQAKAAKDIAQIQKNGFGTQAMDAVITDANGQKRYGTVYRKPGEEGLVDSAGKPVTSAVPMSSIQEDAYKTIRTETQKIGNELAIANAAITEGMRTAVSAVEIVRNDQRVRGAGGKAALAIRNLVAGGGELLSVAEGLFEGKPDDHKITIEELKATGSFDNNFLNAVVSGDVQNLATETARFQAKMLSLAFQVGRMEGQSGNAMSNQDFKKIMEIVNTGGGAEAFETSLIDYMGTKLKGYDDKTLNLIAGNTNVATFKQDYGFLPIAEPLTMAQYVELRDEDSLTSAYKMFSGQRSEPPTATVTGTGDTPEFKPPNSRHIDYLKKNPNIKAAFDRKFGQGAADKVLSQVRGK
jgi:hypothetical protein